MNVQELYEEYLNLSEKDRLIFRRKVNLDHKGQEERLKEVKKDVLKKMMDVKDSDGSPYFSEIYLKDKLGL